MKTENILLLSGVALIAYAIYKNSKKKEKNVIAENIPMPTSTNLTITPIKVNSPTYARNGIYLGYPSIMKL